MRDASSGARKIIWDLMSPGNISLACLMRMLSTASLAFADAHVRHYAASFAYNIRKLDNPKFGLVDRWSWVND
jgi:hypothetical protein